MNPATPTTPAPAPTTYKVTDLKGVIQFFDDGRVKSLAKALVPATAIKWPKAKESDLDAMTQDAMWRILEAGKDIDAYNPSQRANICDQVTKAMAAEYNHRCKKRNLKRKERVQRKGLETNLNLFMTQVTLVAFVLYGDVRKSAGVLMA